MSVLVCMNGIRIAACADKHNFLPAQTLRVSKTVHIVLIIGRNYMIYSAIRKIEEGKQFVRKFDNCVLPNGMNICSVNLDRETNFLTVVTR